MSDPWEPAAAGRRDRLPRATRRLTASVRGRFPRIAVMRHGDLREDGVAEGRRTSGDLGFEIVEAFFAPSLEGTGEDLRIRSGRIAPLEARDLPTYQFQQDTQR